MAVKIFNFRDPVAFDFEENSINLKDGNVSLSADTIIEESLIDNDAPVVTPAPESANIYAITDGSNETSFLDSDGEYAQTTQLEWDLGITALIGGFSIKLAKDLRKWGILVIESTAEIDFTDKTKIDVLYATGTENDLSVHFSGYPTSVGKTHSNFGISFLSSQFEVKQAARIRITIRAWDSSPVPDRVISEFLVQPAKYSSEVILDSKEPIQASDLTSMSETPAATTPTDTEIRYSFVVDGERMWWDGTNWRPSDGTASQSTLLADLTLALPTLLPLRSKSDVLISMHLVGTEYETPVLNGLEVTYDDTDPMPTFPSTRLTGIVRNALDEPLSGVVVKAEFIPALAASYYMMSDVRVENTQVIRSSVTGIDGHFSIPVLPTQNLAPDTAVTPGDLAKWRLTMTGAGLASTIVLEDVVDELEEIDVFKDSFGI